MAKNACTYVISTWTNPQKRATRKTLKQAMKLAQSEAKRTARSYGDPKMVSVSVERSCTNVLRDRYREANKRVVHEVFECTNNGSCRRVRGERARRKRFRRSR